MVGDFPPCMVGQCGLHVCLYTDVTALVLLIRGHWLGNRIRVWTAMDVRNYEVPVSLSSLQSGRSILCTIARPCIE